MGKKIILILFLCVGSFFLGVSHVAAGPSFVRVLVLQEADRLVLGVDGRYTIRDALTGVRLDSGRRLRPSMVALEEGKIMIAERVFPQERLLIEPRDEAVVRVNNRHYRGSVTLVNHEGSSLRAINSVGLEDYVRGVLYHEISDKWPLDAIKAQAVATRTYAVYAAGMFVGRDYDVTNDVYSQVYGGKTAERRQTDLAVRQTRGEVLVFQGKILPAFFHANSGGITEDAAELWKIDLLPLKGGVDSPFSVNSPHYRWKKNFRLKDIQDKLNASGVAVGRILHIRIAERNKNKRVVRLEIVDADEKTYNVDGKRFREIMGPNILRSNHYDVAMKGWYVDFLGYGWGHGVGLDQWGAYNMALKNYSYKQILQFYYPGSRLIFLKDLLP